MIKRYQASKDTAITNAFKSDLITSATGSNQGEADSLQVFSIYGQGTTSSYEKSRILLQFPIDQISTDRTNALIPLSGSVEFYLKLFNAEHPLTLPRQFTLETTAVSGSDWDEGTGLDADEFTDEGLANWDAALSNSSGITYWTNSGSDYYSGSYIPGSNPPSYTLFFDKGTENYEVDVTSMVEEWAAGNFSNYGFCVKLTSSCEDAESSYYVKKFFARGSEYYMKRPIIEARWDDSRCDDRADFYVSSSLATAAENQNTIYLFNRVRGSLRNIPNETGIVYVQMWSDRVSGSLLSTSNFTGGLDSTGIYTASVVLDTTSSIAYDRWFSTGSMFCYATGSIGIKTLTPNFDNEVVKYRASMPGLKAVYTPDEVARLSIFVREKNWQPTIYSVANNETEFSVIKSLFYKVRRVTDNFVVVDYMTGSNETKLSYGISGSYFNFDMSILEPGYMYEVSYLYKKPDELYEELTQKFKFRVEKYED